MRLRIRFALSTIALAASLTAAAADKPRVFVTESGAIQLAGKAGDTKGSLALTGGATPQNVEVMRNFGQRCPDVIVTSSREKAEFVVRLDHEGANPTTPFVRGNKVAVFNKDEDLIFSASAHFLANAVKDACAAILGGTHK